MPVDSARTDAARAAAVRAGSAHEHMVVALDTLVDGVHFPSDTPARDVGYKALAVNLSDLAAMGATATEAVAVASIPERLDPAWLAAFQAGFESLAGLHGVSVTAVDAVVGALSVTVEVHGRCPAGEALTRAGARAGDRIFVSGTLGDAGGGLEVALGHRAARPRASADELLGRLRRPTSRLALGTALRGIASAAIDVSDGCVRTWVTCWRQAARARAWTLACSPCRRRCSTWSATPGRADLRSRPVTTTSCCSRWRRTA